MKSQLYCSHWPTLYILNNQARLDNTVLWKLILLKVWMKESIYFSSCDAASNLGCYCFISEFKKMCPTETGNEHYWGCKCAWSKCYYIKNKQNKITKQIKKRIWFCLVNSSILDLKLIRSIRSVKQYFRHSPHWKLNFLSKKWQFCHNFA